MASGKRTLLENPVPVFVVKLLETHAENLVLEIARMEQVTGAPRKGVLVAVKFLRCLGSRCSLP